MAVTNRVLKMGRVSFFSETKKEILYSFFIETRDDKRNLMKFTCKLFCIKKIQSYKILGAILDLSSIFSRIDLAKSFLC